MKQEIKQKIDNYKKIVEENLDKLLPVQYPETIFESMRYSVLAGGKRLRPILTLEICSVFCGSHEPALATACAIEMLHSQSLIHDDLPCMDNDDYRRGRLTNHKVYGEAMAVLAGDALLSYAPQIILQNTPKTVSKDRLFSVLEEYLVNAGATKLIGGQVVDIESEGKEIQKETLDYIHENKTGALFKLSLRAGAILGGADEKQLLAVTDYAQKLGLAFQIMDDILDVISTLEELGKTPGKDEKNGKVTYVSLYGLEESKKHLDSLCTQACDILKENKIESEVLMAIANNINERVRK